MSTNIDLDSWQIQEITRCAGSPEYFVDTFCWLQHKAAAGRGRPSTIPFVMGRDEKEHHFFQRKILRWLVAGEHVLTRKSRRVGCSWIAAAYGAWLINFFEGVNVVFVSKSESDAKKILKKVQFILKNLAYHDHENIRQATLAAWLCGEIVTDNKTTLEIGWRDDSGEVVAVSTVESVTTTDDAARGDDISFLLFDELAFILHPEETWGSATKTLMGGGNWMAVSTPNMIGDLYHRMVMRGELYLDGKVSRKELGYEYIRIHWTEAGISEDEIERLSIGDTEDKIQQEWELQFSAHGAMAFDPIHLAACYKPPDQFPEIAEALAKYRHMVENGKGQFYYYSGVDTAKGNQKKKRSERDFHSWCSLTKTGIQAFAEHNQDELSKWAGDKTVLGQCSELHTDWPGWVQIENEGPGYTTCNNHVVPDDSFSRMTPVDMKHRFKRGAVERFIIKVQKHQVAITDLFTYQVLSIIIKVGPGQYEGAPGFNDDPFISAILASDALDQEGALDFDFGDIASLKSGTTNRQPNLGQGPISEADLPIQLREIEATIDDFGGYKPEFEQVHIPEDPWEELKRQ